MTRRSLAVLAIGALLATLLPALGAIAVDGEITLVAPDGQTAVNGDDIVRVEGSTDEPNATVDGIILDALDASGAVLESYSLDPDLVSNDDGTLSGGFSFSCNIIPGCPEGDADRRRSIGAYRMSVDLSAGAESTRVTSQALEFDEVKPRIVGYFLREPNLVEVRFSEDVTDPEGDNPRDWEVDDQMQVTDVTGSRDVRFLRTFNSFPQDATPRVSYLPQRSISPQPNEVYEDEADNTLADDRTARAADRIPPAPPVIEQIDGAATSRDGDDQAVAVLGDSPTPTVVVGNMTDGHTAQLYLDDGDNTLEEDKDTFVGSATASGGSAEITWPQELALPDGEHRLLSRALDGADCDPNTPGAGECPNASGSSQDALYDLDTIDPTIADPALSSPSAVTVVLSEIVLGPDTAGDWTITGPGGEPGPAIGDVRGSGDSRVLDLANPDTDVIAEGSTLTYTPTGDAYADEHGNPVATTTVDIIAAPVPALRLVDGAADELNGQQGVTDTDYEENRVPFRVELSDPVREGQTASVTFEVVGIDATAGRDFTDPGEITVEIPGGETGADVSVELIGDELDEVDETFELRVVRNNNEVEVADAAATGTITDDDELVDLSVADTTVTEGGDAQVTASIDQRSGKPVTATWSLRAGTATPGQDYEDITGTLEIPASETEDEGPTSTTITVGTELDDLDEADIEDFVLVLGDATNANVPDGAGEATVGIEDDDPLPRLTIDDASEFEGDGTRTESVAVRLSEASGRAVEVDFSTSEGSGEEGATADDDYTSTSGTLTFPAGTTRATVDYEILGDLLGEADETFTITLSSPVNAAIEDGQGVITLVDDDGGLPPILVDASGATVDEDVGGPLSALFPGQISWTITLNEAPSAAVRVPFRTIDTRDQDRHATPDDDYEPFEGVAEFEPGQTEVTVSTNLVDDDLDEFDETVVLEVDDPEVARVELDGGGDSKPVGATIADDDLEVVAAFTEESAEQVVAEGGEATLVVELDTVSAKPVTVNWATAFDGETATDADAAQQSGSVEIAPGTTTSESFTVQTTPDDEAESDETFRVDLSVDDGSNARLADEVQLDDRPVSATITIADDEIVIPTITFGDQPSISEDDAALPAGLTQPQLPFAIELSQAVDEDVEVDFMTTKVDGDDAADPEDDFTAVGGTVTIPAGETSATVDVGIVDDDLDEFTERVGLTLSNPVGARLAGGTAELLGEGTITDDDPLVELSLTDDEVGEGNPAEVTIELNEVSGKDIPVTYATSSGSGEGQATGGVDYTSVEESIVIEAGTTSRTVRIPTEDDAGVEGDETFDVTITVDDETADEDQRTAEVVDGTATVTIIDDDELLEGLPVVSLTAADVEEGNPLLGGPSLLPSTTMRFDVGLSAPADGDVTIDWETAESGDATAGDDYQSDSGQVTIEDGAMGTTIEVGVFPDGVDEEDETFTVTLTGVDGNAQLPGLLERDGTIVDDDPFATLGFTEESVERTVDEGGTVSFTVELLGATEKDVSVEYVTSFDGSATRGEDADEQSGRIELSADDRTETFTISTIDDDEFEDPEDLRILLRRPVGATLPEDRPSAATLTIDDDELVIPTLDVTGDSVGEDGGLPPLQPPQLTWTFELTEAAPTDVTARFETVADGGSATAESDYTGTSGTVTIPQGETTATVTVDVIDDDLDEFIEEVPLRVSAVDGARLRGGVDAVAPLGRITDDDPVVTVAFDEDERVDEGQPVTLDVALSAPSGKLVRVAYTTVDDSAESGADDYDAQTGELTFEPGGDTSQPITIQTNDDPDVEGDEQFLVELTVETEDAAEIADGEGVATVTVVDNDVLLDGPPVLSMTGDSTLEGNLIGGVLPDTLPTLQFDLSLSDDADGEVTVEYATRPGSATPGEDYTAEPDGQVTLGDDGTGTIDIAVEPDNIDEINEDLVVVVTGVTGDAQLPTSGLERTGRIEDDDPLAVLGFTDASLDVGTDEGDDVTLTVERTGATAKDLAVDFALSFDGGATRDEDAVGQTGTLEFLDGATTAEIVVDVLDDTVDEPAESLSVVLSAPSNAQLDDDADVATVTINDDDLLVPVLSLTGGTVDEGATGPFGGFAPMMIAAFDPGAPSPLEESLVFTVSLSEATERDVTVAFRTIDTGTARAGTDYTATSGEVTIPAGETSVDISVDILDDTLDEFPETVALEVERPDGATLSNGASRLVQTGTIEDDDPLVTVDLGDDVEVAEGNPATFDIDLTAVSGKDIPLRVRTSAGSASAGSDFTAIDRTVTIPAGETGTSVTVSTLDDSFEESTEDLDVTITLLDDEAAELGDGSAQLTITDDDLGVDPDATVVSLTGAVVDEGDPFSPLPLPVPGTTLDFEVRLSQPADGDVTIDFRTRAGTASGDDFTSRSGQVTIADGEREATVPVEVTADFLDEFDEDLTLELTRVSGDAVLPGGQLARTGTIRDDDPAAQLRVSDATVLEGDIAELDVTLDNPSGKDIEVDWSLVDGSATAGEDYRADSGTLTFPAGTTSRTVQVTTLADDDTGELIEQLELVLSNPVNAGSDDPRGTVSIIDIGVDGLPTQTAVFLEDITTTETDTDRTALVPVRLSGETDQDVTVTWSDQRLTAADGEDYRAEGGEVTIPAGATSAQLPVTIIGDDEVEPNEDFLVLLTQADGAVITGPTGRVTIEDDDAETDDGGPGGSPGGDDDGTDGAPDGSDGSDGGDGSGGAPGADGGGGDLAATGGGAGIVVLGLGLLAARRRRRD